jgi:hypothetical protein
LTKQAILSYYLNEFFRFSFLNKRGKMRCLTTINKTEKKGDEEKWIKKAKH